MPSLPWIGQIDRAEPDLLLAMGTTLVRSRLLAEADAICGVPLGARSEERLRTRKRPPEGAGAVRGVASGTPGSAAGALASDRRHENGSQRLWARRPGQPASTHRMKPARSVALVSLPDMVEGKCRTRCGSFPQW